MLRLLALAGRVVAALVSAVGFVVFGFPVFLVLKWLDLQSAPVLTVAVIALLVAGAWHGWTMRWRPRRDGRGAGGQG